MPCGPVARRLSCFLGLTSSSKSSPLTSPGFDTLDTACAPCQDWEWRGWDFLHAVGLVLSSEPLQGQWGLLPGRRLFSPGDPGVGCGLGVVSLIHSGSPGFSPWGSAHRR